MRVIAGSVGGRRLHAPKGQVARPTSDRVKEALFSALAPSLPGARVLDLYAGSGALGIEALSRGATTAVFVESDDRAVKVIRRNLEQLGLEGGIVRAERAERYCRRPVDGPFDVVLADPPYVVSSEEIANQVADLAAAGALTPGALLVVERPSGGALAPVPGSAVAWGRVRAYGDTVLCWGKAEERR